MYAHANACTHAPTNSRTHAHTNARILHGRRGCTQCRRRSRTNPSLYRWHISYYAVGRIHYHTLVRAMSTARSSDARASSLLPIATYTDVRACACGICVSARICTCMRVRVGAHAAVAASDTKGDDEVADNHDSDDVQYRRQRVM